MILDWHVDTESEHLSDHRYVELRIKHPDKTTPHSKNKSEGRWALSKLNREFLKGSLTVFLWNKDNDPPELEPDPQEEAD
ncbi:hypothetical protein PUN28_019719 [Cardiocondyla obscurior]|uniref:Endonuclease/exonuclease/phosphatase domain-containing protein n=1 Tax=Cardiocondyla obscurior TaxID=286306 RepID=A0AAW2EE91_9HYME